MIRGITDPHNAGEVPEDNQTAVAAPEDVVPVDLSAHPETATGHRAIWLQSFERKFLFLRLDDPSMSNPAMLRVFCCAAGMPGTGSDDAKIAAPQSIRQQA
jgi:hypothetical protein